MLAALFTAEMVSTEGIIGNQIIELRAQQTGTQNFGRACVVET